MRSEEGKVTLRTVEADQSPDLPQRVAVALRRLVEDVRPDNPLDPTSEEWHPFEHSVAALRPRADAFIEFPRPEEELKRARLDDVPAAAPMAPRRSGAQGHRPTVGRLRRPRAALSNSRTLSTYARALGDYIDSHGGSQVSIQWCEVALLHDPKEFERWVRRALRFLADPREEVEREARVRKANDALPALEKVKVLRAHSRSLSIQEALNMLGACDGDLSLSLARLRAGKSDLELELDSTEAASRYGEHEMTISSVFTCLCGLRPDEALPTALPTATPPVNLVRTLGTAWTRVPPWEQAGP